MKDIAMRWASPVNGVILVVHTKITSIARALAVAIPAGATARRMIGACVREATVGTIPVDGVVRVVGAINTLVTA